MSLRGKVALVTGGARGLGQGFSQMLLENGAKVVFTDIDQKAGKATAEQFNSTYPGNVNFVQADSRSRDQLKNAFETAVREFQGLDIVVNNAGVGGETDESFELCVDVNLKGAISCARLGLDFLRQDKGGRGGTIVNISSAGGFRPQVTAPVYSATKAGLIMYCRSVALQDDVKKNGVKIHAVCPAFVDTVMFRALLDGPPSPDKNHVEALIKETGILQISEVAAEVLKLVEEPRTGIILAVSKNKGPVEINYG